MATAAQATSPCVMYRPHLAQVQEVAKRTKNIGVFYKNEYQNTGESRNTKIFDQQFLDKLTKDIREVCLEVRNEYENRKDFTPESYQSAREWCDILGKSLFLLKLFKEENVSVIWSKVPDEYHAIVKAVLEFINSMTVYYDYLTQRFAELDAPEKNQSAYLKPITGAELWERRNKKYVYLV